MGLGAGRTAVGDVEHGHEVEPEPEGRRQPVKLARGAGLVRPPDDGDAVKEADTLQRSQGAADLGLREV